MMSPTRSWTVHSRSELMLRIVAGDGLDALQIGLRVDWRIIDRGDKITLRYQFWDLRTFDDLIEEIPKPSTIRSAWCCGQSDQSSIRIFINNLPPSLGCDVVGFIDDDEIGGRQRHFVGAHTARMKRVHARNLDRISQVNIQTSLNKPMLSRDLERRLLQGFLADA